MKIKIKIALSSLVATLLASGLALPAQAQSLGPSVEAFAVVGEESSVPSKSQKLKLIDALEFSYKQGAEQGDEAAIESLRKLDSLSRAEQLDEAASILTGEVEFAEDEPQVATQIPFATPVAKSTTSRQPVACYLRGVSLGGLVVARVKVSGGVWAKNFGATLVRVENPTARITTVYDPTLKIAFSGDKAWKSNNRAHMEIDATSNRTIGWATTGRTATIQFITNSFGITQSCKWVA